MCAALFHEDWYPDSQLEQLIAAFDRVRGNQGAVMEIGCWEGKSTIALANACHPEDVEAIDTWAGSADEDPKHPTVIIAKKRDVYRQFVANVKALTHGNVNVTRRDCHKALSRWKRPLKFVHIDASHDYGSVRRIIDVCLRQIVQGGVICGDDFQTADMSRNDLGGGVERAVREALPGFEQQHNFWLWQKPAT